MKVSRTPNFIDKEIEDTQVLAPEGLSEFQKEFSRTMSVPFEFNNPEKQSFKFQQNEYSEEIVKLMVDRGDFKGIDRLSVYNQQYWFRLLTTMQNLYPVLAKHLGFYEFNQMVSAYLEKHPSRSPSLDHLDDHFPSFLENSPHRWNQQIIVQMAKLDFIFSKSFVSMEKENLQANELSSEEIGALTQQALPFQPSFHLFESNWNLIAVRREVLADKPTSGKNLKIQEIQTYAAIYRRHNQLFVEDLDAISHRLLSSLKLGVSLAETLDHMSSNCSEVEITYLSENIQGWFQKWASLGWFARS